MKGLRKGGEDFPWPRALLEKKKWRVHGDDGNPLDGGGYVRQLNGFFVVGVGDLLFEGRGSQMISIGWWKG